MSRVLEVADFVRCSKKVQGSRSPLVSKVRERASCQQSMFVLSRILLRGAWSRPVEQDDCSIDSVEGACFLVQFRADGLQC